MVPGMEKRISMRWVGLVVGVLLSLIGAGWMLQGVNVLPGSMMTGQTFWAVAGAVTLVIGLALVYLGARGHRTATRA
jgi:hypothetical protein